MVDNTLCSHTPPSHSSSLHGVPDLADDLRPFYQRHPSRVRRHYLLHNWCFLILLAASKTPTVSYRFGWSSWRVHSLWLAKNSIAPLLERRVVHAVLCSMYFPNRTCDYLQGRVLVLGGFRNENASETTQNTKSYLCWTVVYTFYDYRLLFFCDGVRLWNLIFARLSNVWPTTRFDITQFGENPIEIAP